MGHSETTAKAVLVTRVNSWLARWESQGYEDGIPDEVPDGLMDENLAPSFKQLAIAILKNDHALHSLGFAPKKSDWYYAIKHLEKSKDA